MRHLPKIASLLVLVFAFIPAAGAAATLLLRQPALSAEHLAFVYAGDIWIANRDGSLPRRLTSHPAEEKTPLFSPDGRLLAFAAEYETQVDVHVVPVEGGQPRRLTWHPADDIPVGWSADGTAVVFTSGRETDHGRSGQLYRVSLDGGLPRKDMEARVYRGAYDSDESRLAYIAHGSGYGGLFGGAAGWKGYRGGTTPPLQILDIRANSVTIVPGGRSTNFEPLWLQGKLYFLSDRDNEQFNVYRYDPATDGVERLSNETEWDVRALGGHGRTLVYEAGGRLKRLGVDGGPANEIVVSISPDLPQLRPAWQDASKTLQSAHISPTGKRLIVTARGDVFTVPTDKGSTRNVSDTGAVREYHGLWSPDGERIAWLRDGLDGQSLVIASQTGRGEHRTIELGPHFYELLGWSGGDSERIVYQDNHLRLYALDAAAERSTLIATGTRREDFDISLSRDGAWLAYTLERPNYHRDLMLFDFASGRHHAVSDGLADAAAPAFSRDGKYLFFAASTNSGPLQVGLNMTSQEKPYRAGLYAAVLAADGASPLAPASGDENADDGSAAKDGDDEADDGDAAPATRIDVDGLAERIVALPVAERNYASLAVADDGRLYYVQRVQAGATNEPPGASENEANALYRYDLAEREANAVLEGINDFTLSADGKQLLLAKADESLAVAAVGDELEPEPVKLDGARLRVDPRVEWALIFDEAWRMEKEYFYDPDMHGLDWQAVYERFRPLLAHVGRREDLNALLVEMIAEMRVGHNNVRGGEVYRGENTGAGLLGVNLVIDGGRYRLARVYTGESWNPFVKAPLATPGNGAQSGEYLLAINGEALTADDNLFAYLQGTAGSQVTLTVGRRADGRESRDIVVEPVESERELRLWHWVENNRRAVTDATGGRVGYVYLPNTAGAGYTFFNRMFFAQVDKDALIVDERSNGGGQAANYIVEVLSRRYLSGWKDRDGAVFDTPAGALHGPKVMLIDQDAGSGGDYLPYAFRELGIGTLLGTRTWGGLIGISANPDLVDGGRLTVPFFRFFDTDFTWSIENEGVAPDIEVALDPLATNDGRDSQLERAIAEVLRQLDNFSDPVPDAAPPYPVVPGE